MQCLQLRGHNLIPFHFDKQIIMLTQIVTILQCVKFSDTLHVLGRMLLTGQHDTCMAINVHSSLADTG